jgi:hypothetical protein
MATDVPEAPAGLLPPSYERWDAFWASDVATCVNRQADLQRLDALDRAGRPLRPDSRARSATEWTVEGSMGQPVQLDASMSRTESEFGMTPQGRKRIAFKAEQPQEDGDLLDEIGQRRARKASGA